MSSTIFQKKKIRLKVRLVLLNGEELTIPIYEGIDIGLSVLKSCLDASIHDTALIEILKHKITRDLNRREKSSFKESVAFGQPNLLQDSNPKPEVLQTKNRHESLPIQ